MSHKSSMHEGGESLHSHLWDKPAEGLFHGTPENNRQTYGSQTEGNWGETATADARAHRRNLEEVTDGGEGYFQYHAVPGNEERLKAFGHEVRRTWLRTLRRRSQRTRWTWERFLERLGNLLPAVEIQHPHPTERFDAKHPRQEPCA